MGVYQRFCLPRVMNFSCSSKPTTRQRQKVVPLATGRVLEVGLGTGLNLPFYDSRRVTKLWGLEPFEGMRRRAVKSIAASPLEIELLDLPGEEIPLEDASVDTVVITYTLCTIPEADRALRQVHRVLKPGGKLLFTEHGKAPDAAVRKWQDRVNPVWKRIGGGCNLNRDIPALLHAAGFRTDTIEANYIPGWKPASFNYWGVAAAQR